MFVNWSQKPDNLSISLLKLMNQSKNNAENICVILSSNYISLQWLQFGIFLWIFFCLLKCNILNLFKIQKLSPFHHSKTKLGSFYDCSFKVYTYSKVCHKMNCRLKWSYLIHKMASEVILKEVQWPLSKSHLYQLLCFGLLWNWLE